MVRLDFPWPPAELFPNRANRRTGHWGYAKKAKALRTLAWGLTVQARGVRKPFGGKLPLTINVELTPPLRRGKVADEDGVIAALKPARDGIADAIGVDDRHFVNAQPVWHQREGDGAVVISFEA